MSDPLVASRALKRPQGVDALVQHIFVETPFALCSAHCSTFARVCALFALLCTPVFAADPPPQKSQESRDESAAPKSVEPNDVSDAQAVPDALAKWQQTGLPLMQTFCIDCHGEDDPEGDFDLTAFETLSDLSSAEVKRVIEMVQFGAMPPDDYDMPTINERKQLVSSLEATLFSSTCDLTPHAGKVTVRRLNRSEYNNSIRDLFGMDLRPADAFPSDEVGAGFDNNGDVLSLSPMLIEKYIEAAESVSRQVIIDPDDLPVLDLDVPGDQMAIYGDFKVGSFGGRFMDEQGFAWLDIDAPFDGQYRVTVRGGTTSRTRGRTRVAICDADGVLIASDDLVYFGGSGRSDSLQQSVQLKKGKNRLTFIPVLDDRELEVGKTTFQRVSKMSPDRIKSIVEAIGKPTEVDRRIDPDAFPFMFRGFKVSGPRDHPDEAYPPYQFKLVRHVAPKRKNRYHDVEKTAIKNLQPLMRKIFRGPVDEDEVRPYAQLVSQATEEGKSYHRGTQIALSALLVSPRFLFRVEMPGEGAEPDESGAIALTQHQLATRLSYFLWSSTPDQTLLDQADRNQLNTDRLRSHVKRMLQDSRADAMASDFAAQWLGLRNLAGHDADDQLYPGFDSDLKSAMSRETEMLFLHVLRNNLPISEFLTADYSFLNSDLAKHYGLQDNVKTSVNQFQKVSLEGTLRRGLLAHASILTLTSTPRRTSPVLRGKWILENVLGTKAPEPPAGVPELEDGENADENASLREQFELHRQNPSCASCHRVMDQLGFGLDDFDAIGQFRKLDAGKPIDASGALPDGRTFNGGAELSLMLAETEADGLAKTVTERLLTFAIGREVTPEDRCTIDEIVAKTKPNQYRLADIVTEIVLSRPFRFQSVDARGQ